MEEKEKAEKTDLFNILKYREIVEYTSDNSIFRDVDILKDFGPLKAGEKYFDIQFDFIAGQCNVWATNNQEEPNIVFNFTLTAKE